MKKTAIIIAALAVLASCTQAPLDPVQESIRTKVEETVGSPLKKMQFGTFEHVGSTTIGEELEHRRVTFETRFSAEEKLYLKYMSEKKMKNASLKLEEMEKSRKALASIDSLRTVLADSLDEVAYDDYSFTARITAENGVSQVLDGYYACVTAAGETLAITNDLKDLHKGAGRAIPGYVEAIRN